MKPRPTLEMRRLAWRGCGVLGAGALLAALGGSGAASSAGRFWSRRGAAVDAKVKMVGPRGETRGKGAWKPEPGARADGRAMPTPEQLMTWLPAITSDTER